MGTAESSQSSEVGGIGGFNDHSSFRRQSPNVARLIRGENSQKMEYEFPISDVNTTNLGHCQHHSGGSTSNHMILSGKTNRHISDQQINHNDNLLSNTKVSSNETSSLWLSLTSCFGCRTRESNSSTMNPLRDKVHAIRIVRASNDLTPAVFDSHYNIITLEQLRECENNGSGNFNDSSNSTNPNDIESSHNGNGSVSSSKNENSRRIRKKKKKRAAAAAYAARTMMSDDDDTYERTQGRGT
ncbi:unnamed protein product [Rotaria sp. Silwood2]|nr:unnamed protein product [Rotaria sp. Silwood2]CAF2752843.1 unnamed protein product [Rotaria sp. Silwood2]CAF3086644.1 unnamed protein product [Rotaria sp. Silwood2]CAF3233492.1 unnamed protein product [Rotaria sp. Silwood2]CAF3917031.1 unnamed protein product [Rotaria sp. Silwood2]